jgi:hypothetical protein
MASRKHPNQKLDKADSEERRSALESDVEEFLKNGGKIQVVPLGMSGEQGFLEQKHFTKGDKVRPCTQVKIMSPISLGSL